VAQLLPGQARQGLQQLRAIDVSVKKPERRAGCLFFTMRMVDEQGVDVGGGLLKPALGRRGSQKTMDLLQIRRGAAARQGPDRCGNAHRAGMR
jgi:hypothetical protein